MRESTSATRSAQRLPLATPGASDAKNIAFVSQLDNYPRAATVPLTGKASRAFLLLAGSTSAMQSRFDNGEVIATSPVINLGGYSRATLSFWRWKFAREATTAPRSTPPPRFVPVQLAPSAVGLRSIPASEVEIALGPRRCVRVRGPVDPAWLTTVLRAVEALEC